MEDENELTSLESEDLYDDGDMESQSVSSLEATNFPTVDDAMVEFIKKRENFVIMDLMI